MLFLKEALDKITKLLNVLGIKALKQEELLAEEIEQLIQARQDARKEKNFARADEIRNLLLEKGIVLEDTREGVRWKRA
jgi:cysteinyl-tRNA synthetase